MRKKRETHKTPLALFLKKLLADERLSIQAASRIAGCAPSTMHGWLQGALPAETVDKLKVLVNHYGYTLATALSGHPDKISKNVNIHEFYREEAFFDGLAKIRIVKLVAIKDGGSDGQNL